MEKREPKNGLRLTTRRLGEKMLMPQMEVMTKKNGLNPASTLIIWHTLSTNGSPALHQCNTYTSNGLEHRYSIYTYTNVQALCALLFTSYMTYIVLYTLHIFSHIRIHTSIYLYTYIQYLKFLRGPFPSPWHWGSARGLAPTPASSWTEAVKCSQWHHRTSMNSNSQTFLFGKDLCTADLFCF